MGSFNVGGQRYSLMTWDVMKASGLGGGRGRNDEDLPLPMNSNISTIYLDNLLHVIEPVGEDEITSVDDNHGNSMHRVNYYRQS